MRNNNVIQNVKAFIVGILATLAFMFAVPVFARVAQETITVNFNNIQIAVDGRLIQTEFEPFIYQGRTYLPVRDVAEATGFDITWEQETHTVHLTSRVNLDVVPDYPPHRPTETPTPNNKPVNPAITLERAIEIANEEIARLGINAAYRSNSGLDWEKGQWVWEILFRTQGERKPLIEFYINAENGEIVKMEWDD
jgi:uncharacterized membrane protein YkoI